MYLRIPSPANPSRNYGYPAKLSGAAPRHDPLKLAGCPQLLAAPSGGHSANVSGGTLISQRVRSRGHQCLGGFGAESIIIHHNNSW